MLVTMEQKIKHLEFIQAVINRMTNNSFLLKSWCLTIVGGIFALKNDSSCIYVIAISLFVIIFWLLDSYYLLQERLFIALYDKVATKEESEINFSMHLRDLCGGRNTWFECFFSKTLLIFYGFLLLIVLIIFI